MRHRNLSVGQRLGGGFGLLLLTLAALVAAVTAWQTDSAHEQRLFTEQVAPLTARAGELERSILRLAIDVRTYQLTPEPGERQRYRESAERVGQALLLLRGHSKDAEDAHLYQALEPAVQRYLAQAESVSARDPRQTDEWPEAEQELSRSREAAIALVREFVQRQDRKAQAALETMTRARERVSDGLIAASIIALLVSLVLAYFTMQSIRRPTRELLKVAGAVTRGDLQPALAWAPDTQAGGMPERPPRNEMLQIARAFGAAAVALQRREQRLRAHREVASAVASSLAKDRIAGGALRIIVQQVRADAGVLYWRDAATGRLLPLATEGIETGGAPVCMRDSIPGEAVRRRRLVVVRNPGREAPFHLKSGHESTPPAVVAAIPLRFNNEVLGVLLVATLADFDDDALTFLDAAGTEVAIGLDNAKAYEEMAALLQEVQEKSECIEQQNEELRLQNEEIQAQNEEIQVQHEEIQTQTEELQRQNDQLRQQSEELKARATTLAEADQRKDEFLGFLAHELRNPTSAISNGLFVLDRVEPGSEPAHKALTIMQRQTHQLTRLIDDLLDTTRISRGKIELERQPLNLVDVVRDCVADHESAIHARGLELEIALPDEDVWLNGDRTRLCQVLGNLVSNAIKFSEEGHAITIELRVDRAGSVADLRVGDTGCGIEPALLPRLFHPFTQGAASLARTKGGLGLGLALVKSLVELHGGTVTAHSEGPGRGSQFMVRLPLAETPARIAIRPTIAPRSWQVLIVEDNRDAAESLRASAELQGYEVRVVHDGHACLETARVFRPQVVLCDIGLPGIDGYEVARRLRADPSLKGVFIIALTGYAAPQDKARAADAGFDCHVAKPLKMEELESMLAELEVKSRTAARGRDTRA